MFVKLFCVLANVIHTVNEILARSELIRKAVEEGNVMVIGALYDVRSGAIDFFTEPSPSGVTEPSPSGAEGPGNSGTEKDR
jgi:carbonic anhydrase/SulP family sulfate permease